MDAVYRIRAYRNAGKYISSEKTLQQVAKLSNEELARIRPYLKLPKPFLAKTKEPKQKRKKKNLMQLQPTTCNRFMELARCLPAVLFLQGIS